MTKNEEQLEQLTAYLDDELPAPQRAEVEELITRDENARRLYERLRRTSQVVCSLPRGRAPANLVDAVTAQMERQALLGDAPGSRATVRAGPVWPLRVGVAASIALACAVAWYTWPGLQGRDVGEPAYIVADAEEHSGPREDLPASEQNSMDLDVASALRKGKKEAGNRLRALGYVGDTSDSLKSAETMEIEEGEGALFARANDVARARDEKMAPAVGSTEAGLAMGGKPAKPPRLKNEKDRLVTEAAHAPQPTAPAAFELQLASNQLMNADVRRANPVSFGNRIELETEDSVMVDRLVRVIQSDMDSNSIPNVQAVALAEPIEPNQQFYAVQEGEAHRARHKARRMAAALISDEVRVVLNIREDQAVRLFENMQKVADENNAELVWTANEVEIPPAAGSEVARQVLKQLDTMGQTGKARTAIRTDRNLPVKQDTREKAERKIVLEEGEGTPGPDQDEDDLEGVADRSSGAISPATAQSSEQKRPADSAPGKGEGIHLNKDSEPNMLGRRSAVRAPVGGGRRGGPDDSRLAGRAGKGQCVTFSISLRSNTMLRSRRRQPAKPIMGAPLSIHKRPTTQTVSPTDASSKPTTQEAEGG